MSFDEYKLNELTEKFKELLQLINTIRGKMIPPDTGAKILVAMLNSREKDLTVNNIYELLKKHF